MSARASRSIASATQRLYRAYFGVRRRLAALSVPVPPPPGRLNPLEVRRLLVVCTGLIGDTIMNLPALCAARALFPAAELVGLVNPAGRTILTMARCLDRYVVCDGAPLRLQPAARRDGRRLEAEVRSGAFDVGVVFLGDDYAPMLTRAGIPHRVFVADDTYGRLATATYDIDPRTWGPAERLGAWRALGLEPGRPEVKLSASAEARTALSAHVDRPAGRGRIVLHPFGSSQDQWWPSHQVHEFVHHVEARLGLECLVIGAGRAAAEAFPRADGPFRLIDRLNLEQLVALLETSSLVVSTDSGPLHLAGALGRPGVGLFRASRPEHALRYPSIRPIVGRGLEECQKRCAWDRCAYSPCRQMSTIEPLTVINEAAALIPARL